MKLYLISALFVLAMIPITADEMAPLAQHDINSKQIVLQNPYMQVLLSYDKTVTLDSITYSNQPFLRQPVEGSDSVYPSGSTLKLFQNPISVSDETYPLPTNHDANVEIDQQNANVQIVNRGNSPFEILNTYHFKPDDSTLYESVTIKNITDKPISFYPTEDCVYSTEFGVSGMLNPYFRFYSPVADDVNSVTDMNFIAGNPGDKQFKLNQDKGIVEIKHERRGAKFLFTRNQDWMAASIVRDVMKKTGIVCSVDFQYDKPIEKIKDNMKVLISGLDKVVDSYPLSTQVSYVLGKVTLAPNESITIKKTWGCGSSVLPVTSAVNGVAFFRRLEAYKVDNGFALFSISTSPAIGETAFQCIGKDGLPFRTDTVVVLNPLNPGMGTTEIGFNQPLLVSSKYNFGVVLPATASQSANLQGFATEETPPKAKSLRFVIIDPKTKETIRLIDEVHGPWKDYNPELIK